MVDLVGAFSFLAGIIAGAGGSFGGKYLWQNYRRPKLRFDPDVNSVKIEENDSNRTAEMVFRVSVTNRGKSAAKNCRPRIHLKAAGVPYLRGEHDESSKPDAERGDTSNPALPSPPLLDMEINTAVVWSEGQRKSRITINADETVTFDLLRVDWTNQHTKTESEREYPVEFPSERGWERPAKIYAGVDEHPVPSGSIGLTKYQVVNADWEVASVEVTCENADKAEGSLNFREEELWMEISVC